ncbi:class I SAM-dependent methyltransferase [Desmonostoc muscorum LEGE 12446]|uniref:Class I SAM-dependent methyltransferase n=1 Tax=Desmonostoc muscorum LEGE 12446 TaxID=1828758 RepID=A0A8J7ADF7_DESMC|nr:methyltransferase domain-containing protein [Desmonostoc muscorum]MCF2146674.1 class I SAM-dependent methyltransferase [Desmonostoc muscorum LEGE 12446]
MLQPQEELEEFYQKYDPWDYEITPDDHTRKSIILSEIPERQYQNVLDIGCGHGFITRELPGTHITAFDVSANAISHAKKFESSRIKFMQSSIFEIPKHTKDSYDLITITGVLYSQYIGKSFNLVYKLVDSILREDGILLCCHINDWYSVRFPYLMLDCYYFPYRDYTQRLEVYIK